MALTLLHRMQLPCRHRRTVLMMTAVLAAVALAAVALVVAVAVAVVAAGRPHPQPACVRHRV
jgi:hypothetical protein